MRTLPLVAALAAALVLPAAAAAPPDDGLAAVAPVKTQVVGTDAVSDWGGGGDNAIVGHTLSQDLLSAAIGLPDAETLDFVLEVTFLPSTGGVPEATRYTWNFLVDGREFELDGKFTNYSRGACDPTSGQCPPPRDPGEAPFLLRGNCTTGDGNVTLCQELGLLHARFDPAARRITIPVPTELLGAGECTTIRGGTNLFGGSVSAAPSAYFTSSVFPLDTMVIAEAFRIPTDDPDGCPA